jgi:Flp pilus assembly protein TadG
MASLIRRRLRSGEDDRGAELIELAIVLPILLLACAAIMDFGFLFQRYEVLTNAAREGARLASLPGYVGDAVAGNGDQIETRVANYLAASGLSGATITTTYSVETIAAGVDVDVATVLVTLNSPFTIIGGMANLVMGGSAGWGTITLRAASTMRIEGS